MGKRFVVGPETADKVLCRAKEVLFGDRPESERFDADVARYLKMTPQAVGKWRERGVPIECLAEIAFREGVSLDWLLFGVGVKKRRGMPVEEDLSPEEIRVFRRVKALEGLCRLAEDSGWDDAELDQMAEGLRKVKPENRELLVELAKRLRG